MQAQAENHTNVDAVDSQTGGQTTVVEFTANAIVTFLLSAADAFLTFLPCTFITSLPFVCDGIHQQVIGAISTDTVVIVAYASHGIVPAQAKGCTHRRLDQCRRILQVWIADWLVVEGLNEAVLQGNLDAFIMQTIFAVRRTANFGNRWPT